MAERQPIPAPWRPWPASSGPYLVRLHIGVVEDRPATVGLEMWGTTPPVTLSRSDLDALEDAARAVLKQKPSLEAEQLAKMIFSRVVGKRRLWRENEAPKELTAQAVRVPVRQLTDEALDDLRRKEFVARVTAEDPGGLGVEDDPARDAILRQIASDLEPVRREPRRGRPTAYDEAHWRGVAEVWRAARAKGSTHATSDIAGAYHVSKGTAARWVSTCRQRGLLPPSGGRGRAEPGRSK